jgi:hypothetical protein
MAQHHFYIFADYFQFYLQDEEAVGGLSEAWTTTAHKRMLGIDSGTIVVGTVRNMTVPVDVEVLERIPRQSLDSWDHVVDCAIEVASGKLVIAGCTDYFPEAARISIAPGTYRVRVYYGRLGSIGEDRLKGDDRYHITLWPGEYIDPVVVKCWLGSKNR